MIKMFRFKAITKQYSTENPEKIAVALRTILSGEVQEEKIGDDTYLFIESDQPRSLDQLFELIRQQRILDVARKTLRNNIIGNSTFFYLNKQVAFVGKLNFCDEEGESPLGPIRVEIEYDNIDQLVDWLTPYTKKGAEIRLVKNFP
ncbi:MAG: hypothetical protein FK730_09305 [Asgard group archaeon]|nr:hypothetical protein [Asgard group archaeon]